MCTGRNLVYFAVCANGGVKIRNQEMFVFSVHFIYMKLLCLSACCVSLLEN